MRIVEIEALSNGAHRNQSGNMRTVPEGWAVIPDGMEPENFPFGAVTAEEVDGVMTVTGWTPGTIPEPEPDPEPDPTPTTEERLAALEANKAEQTDVDELNEALALILSGDTGEEAATDEA